MKRLLAVALLVCGCAAEREAERPAEQRIERPGDATSRWVRNAQQIHELADKATDTATKAEALRQLIAFAEMDPSAAVTATDAVITRQDLYGRAAQIALELGRPDRALQLVEQGLGLPAVAGPFRTQLFIVASKVKAALGDHTGSVEAARAAKGSLN